ncbi:related to para-aminobenzoic acid synthetase [Melanopsichium pennsylvanicum]|uniref:aminodeoxychorismate synthase n=2 Tax=Melanopsichium pennsylvanicum TaxID=63383 RepID=A0AAJ5C5Z7_9BASI|nr:related to para-aminobenzoic acid synthetase [Melanopsichium pennsylvanicum 4]SNX85261.1 related to para-aminobenzoic acid synthetase [Melanopsichium pennsylvanicum]
MSLQLPRILVVDHFDSYTLNLLSLLHPTDTPQCEHPYKFHDELTRRIAERVIVLPHTHPLLAHAAFHELVRPHIDAIILSPGPGSPDKAADFAAAETLLKDEKLNLPVFGVCLGHQGLAVAFGGQITRAISVRHGLQSKLKILPPYCEPDASPRVSTILQGVSQDALVVRYNSLVVDPDTLPDCLQVTAWSYDQVSTAPPPRPGKTKQQSSSVPIRVSNGLSPPSKHRDLTSFSRSPSTVPISSRNSSELGDIVLSEATSVGDVTETEGVLASDSTSSPAIMALQHKILPFHGVQFHPESIESTWGHTIMANFLHIVRQYWEQATFDQNSEVASDARARVEAWDAADLTLPPHLTLAGERCLASDVRLSAQPAPPSNFTADQPAFTLLTRRSVSLASDSIPDMVRIFDQLFRSASPAGAVWFDSARYKDPHSRYSFMAVPSFVLSYKDGSDSVIVSGDESNTSEISLLSSERTTLWTFMNQLQSQLQSSTDLSCGNCTLDEDQQTSIFRTGFTGYWGYEMKNESLQLETPAPVGNGTNAFDAEFLYCPLVLAFDHHQCQWITFALADNPSTVSSLSGRLGEVNDALQDLQGKGKSWSRWSLSKANAEAWMEKILRDVVAHSNKGASTGTADAAAFRTAMPTLRPRMLAEDYMDQIESARELIAAGESYELCMTTQFQGRLPPLSSLPEAVDTDHFDLYCKLRARNPAPYSAYIKLPSFATSFDDIDARKRGRAILSTSPERFMRITSDGQVEMKPIKGTLARAGFGPGEQSMRADGGGCTPDEELVKRNWRETEDEARRAKLSADIKERAENLMIVDLIRADLFSFCTSDSVAVPKLMQVETYETVHQLVTTVTGQLKASVGTTEAIRRCFPPGSMTGAPKRRSVQLLERLELNLADAERDDGLRARRGIYSGALGWLGCDGAADFSVVIRTLIADGDDVSIGAGGAITYLSDAEKEWQEVLDKVSALASIDV